MKAIFPRGNKTVIADSPGFHFRKSIWNRFRGTFKKELDDAATDSHLPSLIAKGDISDEALEQCHYYTDWKFGYMQSYKDIVMSFFGRRFPASHKRRVLGKYGLLNVMKDPDDLCQAWTHKESSKHVFGESNKKAHLRSPKTRKPAMDFIEELYKTTTLYKEAFVQIKVSRESKNSTETPRRKRQQSGNSLV